MSRYKSNNSSIRSHSSTNSLPKEEVNIVLLGKQNVGKSALVVKYLTKRFIREYDPFLEETYWKPDVVDQQEVLVKVMDTYGKDEKLLPYYLKWADAVLITYSIAERDSFETALNYLEAIKTYSNNLTTSMADLVLIVLGTKLDLERIRVVSKSEGESICVKFECDFCETTSVDDYEYVQQLFHRAVRQVRKERQSSIESKMIIELPSNWQEIEQIHSSTIPMAPPIPSNFIQKQTKTSFSALSTSRTGTLPSNPTVLNPPPAPSTSTPKRTPSKSSSVFSKIFK